MTYWQIAAGQGARDYSEVFLKFGIMLVGAGNPGSYFDNQDHYKSRNWGRRIVHFAEHVVEDEDYVVLKKGAGRGEWEVRAVGLVVGGYEHLEQFGDVEGWDLQHCRSVHWKRLPEKTHTKELSRGTFSKINRRWVKVLAQRIWEEGQTVESEDIPFVAKTVSDEDLVERLIGNGLRPADAETVIQTIWRVRRLARWYQSYGSDLSEHEIRTFLIAPIMLALGWSEQKIKIEWKNTDMSFFSQIYRRSEEPCMILESKRIHEGLDYAEKQLIRYAKNFPECRRLVASDGIRFQLYIKQNDQWNLRRDFKSYMNLLNLKERHPYLENIGGAPDLCANLMPN